MYNVYCIQACIFNVCSYNVGNKGKDCNQWNISKSKIAKQTRPPSLSYCKPFFLIHAVPPLSISTTLHYYEAGITPIHFTKMNLNQAIGIPPKLEIIQPTKFFT